MSTANTDAALRPLTFDEYHGQPQVLKTLRIMVEAAKIRSEAVGHMLFSGPAGLGKTTIANIVANEMGSNLHVLDAQSIKGKDELISALVKIQQHDVVFIDEIHRLNIGVEENLYPAIEDYYITIKVGDGAVKHQVRFPLPRFTMVAATTREGLVSTPLRTRFNKIFKMQYYSEVELATIAQSSAKKLGLALAQDAANDIARRSRGTPRTVNQHLRMIRDYATIASREHIDLDFSNMVMNECGIDAKGLGPLDREYMGTLINTFEGGPAGLQTLARAIGEEATTLQANTEPYLLQIGFIKYTSRGRVATPAAVRHSLEV